MEAEAEAAPAVERSAADVVAPLHGLLYEDVMIETADVKLALKRMPKELMVAREQRLKRAMMLDTQQKTLPPEVAAQIDPWQSYMGPYLEGVQKENAEQILLK